MINGTVTTSDRAERALVHRCYLTTQEDLRRHMNRQLLHDSGLSLADFDAGLPFGRPPAVSRQREFAA